jgi:hypothetical protein
MDLASNVKPGIFIVDDVALPPPITFLVLPGGKAVAAKLAGGRLGLASGGARVGRPSETGSDNDDSEGQSGDERLHDTSPSIAPYPARVQDAMDGVNAAGACRRAFETRSAGDRRTAQDQSASRADVDPDRGLTGPR